MKKKYISLGLVTTLILVAILTFSASYFVVAEDANSNEVGLLENLACNPDRTGYPHPLESDDGWGGGSDKWDIVDGKRSYENWWRGLAFTGGPRNWGGESCGWRQATINFGQPRTFNMAVVWHSALKHVPNTYKIQYWDEVEEKWEDVFSTTDGHDYLEYETATKNTFAPVTSNKIRFTLNNCDIVHGWIKEFEVYLDCANDVPYFPQCDERWGDDPYDHIETTICTSGCALASAAMVLKDYEVETNPRELNNWLKNQQGGYDREGGVNWFEVANYSDAVSYWGTIDEPRDSLLNQDLCEERPPILYVGGHFVVATAITQVGSADTWSINDPGHPTRNSMLDYDGNTYYGMRRFGPAQEDDSALMLRAYSPIELFVTDPQGRSLGIEPATGRNVTEIPDAIYYREGPLPGISEVKVAEIRRPVTGVYTITVSGTGDGTYDLDTYDYLTSGELSGFESFTGEIAQGEIHEYTVSHLPSRPIGGVSLLESKFELLLLWLRSMVSMLW